MLSLSVRLNTSCERLVQGSRGLTWYFDHYEILLWVEIIFTTFINDPYITIFGSILIRQHPINLVQLQRSGVLRIVYTNSEP
ncbi:MAG: hypothetical protein AUI36_20585 [Cyanobacteria bacterium 13_1_40CM_2_61_4]|nr:MAG: hypothetical protein AUI36_20585 [Cyanobacteria bacterium 13_1_40CM_2_61_4]